VRAVEASKQEFWSMRAIMASNMFFFSIVVRRNSASQLLHCFSWLLNQGKSMARCVLASHPLKHTHAPRGFLSARTGSLHSRVLQVRR